MIPRKLHFREALLPQGVAADVTITIGSHGEIAAVRQGDDGEGAERVSGFALPGMPNVHSHAHQRAMAGLAERSGPAHDSFWTWRDAMYSFALKMNPEEFQAIASQAYMEMAKAGFTSVGEFHYLHHQPDGQPYANPAEMSFRCIAAAAEAGIALTLLPTLYMQSGFGGAPLTPQQRRFGHDVDGYLALLDALRSFSGGSPNSSRPTSDFNQGVSFHSCRAVEIAVIKLLLRNRGLPEGPVHMHVAEQRREVEDCIEFAGQRPVELLLNSTDVDARWCLIHATHMTLTETSRLANSGATVGLCPLTEANLGDGIFPGRAYRDEGGAFAIGSDSNVEVTVTGELQMLEYSQRLQEQARNILAGGPHRSTGLALYEAAAVGGAVALGQPRGALREGLAADIVVLDLDDPALIERRGEAVIDSFIFAGGGRAVRDVFIGGRQIVSGGHHRDEAAITARFRTAMASLMRKSD